MARYRKPHFYQPFPEGFRFSIGGKQFLLVEIFLYETKRGEVIDMARWEGECAKCDEPFRTIARTNFLPDGRNCDLHKIHRGVKS